MLRCPGAPQLVFAISAAVGWECAAPATSDVGPVPPVDDPTPATPDAGRVPPPGTGGGGGKTGGAGADGSDAGNAPEAAGRQADGADGDADGADGPKALASTCRAPSCDDFESYATGARPGGPWGGFEVSASGGLAVDETRAFSGRKSVKMTVSPSGDMRARMKHNGGGLLPAPAIYMRMMMFLEKPVKGPGSFHWNFMRADQGNYPYIAAGGDAAGHVFQLFEWSADCYDHGAISIPTGKWVCVEYHVDGQADSSDISYDGQLDASTQILNGYPPRASLAKGSAGCVPSKPRWDIPPVVSVKFGPMMYHTLGEPMTMWVDDVVVSTKPIGCPR